MRDSYPDVPVCREVLENGLRVLATGRHGSPLITAVLSIDAGSRYERAGAAGLAAVTAATMIEGTSARTGADLARHVDAAGSTFDVSAGYETAVFSVTGLPDTIPRTLELLREVVSEPAFDEREFEEARRAQLAELAEDDEDPGLVCRRELFEALYPGHPRGRPSNGTPAGLRSLTRDDLVSFHGASYRPQRAVLAVAGDCDPRGVLAEAADVFAGWRPGDTPPPPAPPAVPLVPPAHRTVRMDREQSHVALGHLSVTRSDPRLYALRALDVILGDAAGFSSRLPARLREAEGLAYIVECDASSTAGLDPGVFWSYAATAPGQVGRVIEAIRDEMRRIRVEPPTDEERDLAVSFLLGRHLLDREAVEFVAARLTAIERYALGLDYDARYVSIISSLTAADIRRVAAEVIRPDDLALVVVGPGDANSH